MVHTVIKLRRFRNLLPLKIYPLLTVSLLWNSLLHLFFFINWWYSIYSRDRGSSRWSSSQNIVIIDYHAHLWALTDIFMEVFYLCMLIACINLLWWLQTIGDHPPFLYLHLEFPQFSVPFRHASPTHTRFINRLLSCPLQVFISRSQQYCSCLIWSHACWLLYYDLLFH